jgi:hypothetical protein
MAKTALIVRFEAGVGKAPSAKHQASREAPNTKLQFGALPIGWILPRRPIRWLRVNGPWGVEDSRGFGAWGLELGASLELGAWILELFLIGLPIYRAASQTGRNQSAKASAPGVVKWLSSRYRMFPA